MVGDSILDGTYYLGGAFEDLLRANLAAAGLAPGAGADGSGPSTPVVFNNAIAGETSSGI